MDEHPLPCCCFRILAVVPLLALVTLLTVSDLAIETDIGIALLEAMAILGLIIVGGRYLLQPVLSRVASYGSAEIFTASAVLSGAWICRSDGKSRAVYGHGRIRGGTVGRRFGIPSPGDGRDSAIPWTAAWPVLHVDGDVPRLGSVLRKPAALDRSGPVADGHQGGIALAAGAAVRAQGGLCARNRADTGTKRRIRAGALRRGVRCCGTESSAVPATVACRGA